jgi:hypothetical protein
VLYAIQLKRNFYHLATAFWICLVCIACNAEKDTVRETECDLPNTNANYNVLFVGNSLTFTNNLPQLVQETAAEAGIIMITKMVAYPNYGLEDHWNDGEIQALIACKTYDVVIIQQGPSSQAYGRESLLEYGGRISQLCRENNAQLAFFMVWPSLANYNTFSGVIENYTNAASANNALLCPVGKVWKEYFDETSDFSYYGSDGFHPSVAGSRAAASIIFSSLDL